MDSICPSPHATIVPMKNNRAINGQHLTTEIRMSRNGKIARLPNDIRQHAELNLFKPI